MLPRIQSNNPISNLNRNVSEFSTIEQNIRSSAKNFQSVNSNVSKSFNVVMSNISDQMLEASRSSNAERIEQLKTFDYLLNSIKKIEFNSKEERDIAMAAYQSAAAALKHNTSIMDKIGSDIVNRIGDVTGMLSNIFTDMPPIFGYLSTRMGDFASNLIERRKTKVERVDKLQSEISNAILSTIEPFTEEVTKNTSKSIESDDESLKKLQAIQENTKALVEVWDAAPQRIAESISTVEEVITPQEQIERVTEESDKVEEVSNTKTPFSMKDMFGKFTGMFLNFFSKGLLSIFKTALLVPLGIMIASGVGYLYSTFSEEIGNAIDWIKEKYDASIQWVSDSYDETMDYWKGTFSDAISYISESYSDIVRTVSNVFNSFIDSLKKSYETLMKSFSDQFITPITNMFKDLFSGITDILPDWIKETLDIPTKKDIEQKEQSETRLTIPEENKISSIENSVKFKTPLVEELYPQKDDVSELVNNKSYKEMNDIINRDLGGVTKTVNSNVQSVVAPNITHVTNNNSYTNRLITVSDPMAGLAAGASR